MRSFVYIASFMVAAAAATPVELQARSLIAGSSSSNQGAQSQDSFNAGPGGISQSHSASSFSNQQSSLIVQGFQPLLGLINQVQGSISSGVVSQSVASSFVNQFVSQFQPLLGQLNNCGCAGSPAVVSSFNSLFSSLYQVMQTFQSSLGNGFGQVVLPFQQLVSGFQSFNQQYQQSSSFNSISQAINPLLNFLQPFVPGFGNIVSSQSSSGQSSFSRSSSNVGPWGAAQSSASGSSSYQQSSQIVQGIQPIIGLVGQLQGMIGSNSISQSVASSYISQIASQLQPVLNGFANCGCINSPNVAPLITNLFGQLTQVFQSFQSSYGSSFASIVNPFQGLLGSFQTFAQQSQQSSASSTFSQTFNPLIQVLQGAIPGYGNLLVN
ncbi:hypothetical protein PCANC_15855 [Puccinia coronata f. sp. avenae]|uniref:Uncharacterized protein n=1 Tax=Puccinia coronata f. sp. avenae TaxID=200324 RepID=A0A2N5SQT1_9BASI|nr:hypothetical protein PCANC_15855 [Puccinia coronata f. sp. avenae]